MALLWAIAVLVIGLVYWFTKKPKYNFPPGPKGLPFLGNLLSISEYPWESYDAWSKKYGKMCTVTFPQTEAFVLSDAKLIKEALNDPRMQGRPREMLLILLSKGLNGVLLSEGVTWVEQRRFTLRHLRDFGFGKSHMESLIMDEVNDLIETFKKESSGGKSVEMKEKFVLPVINSLWMIVSGKKFKQDDEDKIQIITDLDKYFGKMTLTNILWFLWPGLCKLLPGPTGLDRCNQVAQRLHDMLKESVDEHEKTLAEDGNPRDFIDAYLLEIRKTSAADSSFYKDEGYKQLLAGIGDLFFAGTETTSTTLSWMVLYLAVNPQVQKKLQKEIQDLTGNSRHVTLGDKPHLPYVEATILETLRTSSIVGQGVLHRVTEDATLNGYDIPKGSWIVPNQNFVHQNPQVWGDPENFRPERFLSVDEKTVVKNENLMPFSVGRRACIGETLARDEIFLFTANIFQRFNVTLDSTKPVPNMKGLPGFIRLPEHYFAVFMDRNQ